MKRGGAKGRGGPVVKAVLYGFLLFVTLFLQIGPLTVWRVAGVAPLWLPVLAIMVAVREGERYGLFYGLAAGLLCWIILPRGGGFYAVFIMLACMLAGNVTERFLTKTFATTLLWCLAAFAAMDILFFLFFYLLPGRAGFGALWRVALPETVFSVLSAQILYLPVKGISRLCGSERRQGLWKA
ncbi:MAG: rod shape-determining protein MreD [Oscillospiraceae bacterium]|jgi:rod shape-determining protein MreD|nr:rod shape-determining protein MreD [Oscillospiraceae bacterium]